jgi:uncharacterized phage protein (TIGR01671 family)
MSREIKFRGQRVDNGEWVYGCLLLDKSRNDEYAVRIQPSEDGQYFAFTVIPETVGQYTGLKDNNGKEIYEGDLIITRQEDEDIFKVEWDEDTARFILSTQSYTCDFDNYNGTDCEVIGNINEDGDLVVR